MKTPQVAAMPGMTPLGMKPAIQEVLVPNPDHGRNPKTGDVVTCHYSGRKITVTRSDATGAVFERIEKTHPSYVNAPEPKERYIGISYKEFEPMFVTAARRDEKERLRKAAPELLGCLKDLVKCIRNFELGDYSPLMDEIFDAEHAIELAEGDL